MSGDVFAISWSGGKDSTLALDRALEAGLSVRYLFNLYDAASGRVAFHGVRAALIRRQAERLGLEMLQLAVPEGAFEPTFLDGLDQLRALGVSGILFGNIHLADVRAWYEERTVTRGFRHVEPLWGELPSAVVSAFLTRGYRALLTGVDVQRGRRDWLGRELDGALAAGIAATPDVDAAGESGEFHTYVFDGPRFTSPIHLVTGEVVEARGHAQIDLLETPV